MSGWHCRDCGHLNNEFGGCECERKRLAAIVSQLRDNRLQVKCPCGCLVPLYEDGDKLRNSCPDCYAAITIIKASGSTW